jgi:pimeloyl-ACP methyl ester carboxylesterase
MNANTTQTVAPISTYFRVCDGVRVRFADNRADSDVTMLLLAPWPESLWAFRRIWNRVSAAGRVVAIDMPGFGHSDGRPELIAPDTSGAFLARLIDEWDLGAPHVVGPDVGTAAALFLAARAPERVTSLTRTDRPRVDDFLDGRELTGEPPELRTVQRGQLMLVYLTAGGDGPGDNP